MKYRLDIFGFMAENELQQISKWAESVPSNGVIVEVGSFLGRSSTCWAMSSDPSVTIYCVDDYGTHDINGQLYDGDELFTKNMMSFPNIIKVKGCSPYEITYTGNEIDIFFLDAGHSNPSDIDTINYFLPYIKNGGLLCGHDYFEGFDDVKQNISDLETRLNQRVTVYESTSLWSFKIEK